MKKLFTLLLIVCLTFITACASSSSTGTESGGSNEGSASSVTLKLGHYFTTEDFRGKTAEHFANLVHEKSNGNIKIEVYPNEQLVKGKEGLQATAQGTIDMYTVLTTYIGGQVPLFDFFNLPFPSPSYTDEVMYDVLEEAKPFLNEELKKNNVYNLGPIGSTGSAELFFSKPIHKLEEMDGIKLRGAGGLSDNALNSFGSSVTFMSSAEQYLALQTGTVDGVSTTYSSYMANNLHEVAPYWLNVTLLRAPYLLMVNQQKWDSLTSEQQQVLEESIS
ncbi:MAG: TRAP transporter substrate-binding protein [Bacillota bacterium]